MIDLQWLATLESRRAKGEATVVQLEELAQIYEQAARWVEAALVWAEARNVPVDSDAAEGGLPPAVLAVAESRCWLACGDGARAEAALTAALGRMGKRPPELVVGLANAVSLQGRQDEAGRLLEAAVAADPECRPAVEALATLWSVQEGPAAMEAKVRALAARHPNAVMPLLLLGTLMASRREYAAAVALLEEAQSRNPAHRGVLGNLLSCHLLEGNVEAAIRVGEAARNQGAADAELLISLGGSYRQAGRLEDAMRAYRAALALAKDPELRKLLSSLLEAAGGPS